MLASLPVYLIARGAPGTVELTVFAWLVVPILSAYFLSRTGHYASAHALSSLALAGLITAVAARTGGIASFAAIWLVMVPLEAALSASRRVVAMAATVALSAAGLLVLLGALRLLPTPDPSGHELLAALGVVSACLCAAGLALGAEELAHAGFDLIGAEEEPYRLLAGNTTEVITRHGGDGAVLFVSPAGRALFGCRTAQLLGQGLFERVHLADRPAYLTALGDAAALGESRSVEFRARCDSIEIDGRARPQFAWIEMRCRPLDRAATEAGCGGAREVVAVQREVTERVRQEQALEEARAEARRANDAKGRFLATMSHELRTPLNAIIGFSEMLVKESALALDAKRRRECAGLINESGRHLLAVVNGILDMSRIESDSFEITPEPFAPAPAAAACCDLLAPQAREAGVRLDLRMAEDLPEIVADKRAVSQILLNLLSNAIRFSDRGGTVTLAARAEAGAITFVVEDHGLGIGEDDLSRLGEPYFQTRAGRECRGGGTGLGLSIVKGLVRLHGGEFAIRNRLGEGTRVTVQLPLDCRQASSAGRRRAGAVVSLAGHTKAASNASGATRGDTDAMSAVWVKKSA